MSVDGGSGPLVLSQLRLKRMSWLGKDSTMEFAFLTVVRSVVLVSFVPVYALACVVPVAFVVCMAPPAIQNAAMTSALAEVDKAVQTWSPFMGA